MYNIHAKSNPIGKNHVITHRGLEPTHDHFFSESSLEAFENHLSRGFGGIEFDPNPTIDGIIVMHDATLARPTNGKDSRPIASLTTAEITQIPLSNGHIPTFDQIMQLIQKNPGTMNSLHLKARFQTKETLQRIIEALEKYTDVFPKLIVFDVKPQTARILKKKFPALRLAPSVAHSYDIKRYGGSIGDTLIPLEEALRLREEGIIDGIWGDEWDTLDENGTSKLFYTKAVFDQVHKAGMFVALVTPELHGTSPGLYGGESHPDAIDRDTLFKRIKQIKEEDADYFCTDYPKDVAKL